MCADTSPSLVHREKYLNLRNSLVTPVVAMREACRKDKPAMLARVHAACDALMTVGELMGCFADFRSYPEAESIVLPEIRGRHNPFGFNLYAANTTTEKRGNATYDAIPLDHTSDPPLVMSAFMRQYPFMVDDIFKRWFINADRYAFFVDHIAPFTPEWQRDLIVWGKILGAYTSNKYVLEDGNDPPNHRYYRSQPVDLWQLCRPDPTWALIEDKHAFTENLKTYKFSPGVFQRGAVCTDVMYAGTSYTDATTKKANGTIKPARLPNNYDKFYLATMKDAAGNTVSVHYAIYVTVNLYAGPKFKFVFPHLVPEDCRDRLRQLAAQFGRRATVSFLSTTAVPNESNPHWFDHLTDDAEYCRIVRESAGPDGTVFLVDGSQAFPRDTQKEQRNRLYVLYGGDPTAGAIRVYTITRANMNISALDHHSGLCHWLTGVRFKLERDFIKRTNGAAFTDCSHMFEEIDVPMLQRLFHFGLPMIESYQTQTTMHLDLDAVHGFWRYPSISTPVPIGYPTHDLPPHCRPPRKDAGMQTDTEEDVNPADDVELAVREMDQFEDSPPIRQVDTSSLLTIVNDMGGTTTVTWDDVAVLPIPPAAIPALVDNSLPVIIQQVDVARLPYTLPTASARSNIPTSITTTEYPAAAASCADQSGHAAGADQLAPPVRARLRFAAKRLSIG